MCWPNMSVQCDQDWWNLVKLTCARSQEFEKANHLDSLYFVWLFHTLSMWSLWFFHILSAFCIITSGEMEFQPWGIQDFETWNFKRKVRFPKLQKSRASGCLGVITKGSSRGAALSFTLRSKGRTASPVTWFFRRLLVILVTPPPPTHPKSRLKTL